jgi:hypothetical protein
MRSAGQTASSSYLEARDLQDPNSLPARSLLKSGMSHCDTFADSSTTAPTEAGRTERASFAAEDSADFCLFVLVPPRSYAPRAVRIWESDRKCVCLPRAGGYERGGSARPVVVGNSPASTSLPRCSPARSPPHRCSLLPGPLQSVEQNVCPPPCRCPRCLGGTRL